MSLFSEISYEINMNKIQKLKEQYLLEMKTLVKNYRDDNDDFEIEWEDEFLNPVAEGPLFDKWSCEMKNFNILLGKYLAISEYQDNLNF